MYCREQALPRTTLFAQHWHILAVMFAFEQNLLSSLKRGTQKGAILCFLYLTVSEKVRIFSEIRDISYNNIIRKRAKCFCCEAVCFAQLPSLRSRASKFAFEH